MYSDEISPRPQLFQLYELNVELGSNFCWDKRVIANCLGNKRETKAVQRGVIQPVMSVIVEKASGHTDKVIISNQGQIVRIDVQEKNFNFYGYLCTFIPKACMRVATSRPILPSPTIARVFPSSSTPMYFLRSHRPAFSEE